MSYPSHLLIKENEKRFKADPSRNRSWFFHTAAVGALLMPQSSGWAEVWGARAKAQAGVWHLPHCFLHTYNELERFHSLYSRREKTWKQRTFVSFALAFQRNRNEKNSHLKSKSYNTMCFAPKECPSPSLSVKHTQSFDMPRTGFKHKWLSNHSYSLAVCCGSYGSRVENLSLNESE